MLKQLMSGLNSKKEEKIYNIGEGAIVMRNTWHLFHDFQNYYYITSISSV